MMKVAEELKKKYWKIDPVRDFRELIYRSALKFAKRKAFKLKDENGKIYAVTYEEFKNDVEALGTILLSMGLKNKKIGLIGRNSYNWSVAYFAISIIGVVVPIDKELPVEDVINFLNVSEASAIFGDSQFIKNILDKKISVKNNKLKFIKMDNNDNADGVLNYNSIIKDGEKLLIKNDTRFRKLKIEPEKLHILLFTSGTTGSAKGVELSQKNILCDIRSVYGIFKVYPNEQVLSILPIHHTYECSLGFLLVLYAGGCIAYCDGLRHIAKNIKEYKPTVILCVPLLLENMYGKIKKTIGTALAKIGKKTDNVSVKNLPVWVKPFVKIAIKMSLGGRMRSFVVGAAPINPNIVDEFYDMGIPAVQGYGLTECSPLVAGNTDFFHKSDAVGLPIPDVEYKISNPDENGVGEVIVKGDNVMLGYYKDPEKTAQTIKNGWFYTGDLGRVDDDGYLYITGRCKTVIVTKNGKNIYPEELEEYLNQSDVVQECIVLGVKGEKEDETYVSAQIYPNMELLKEKLGKAVVTDEDVRSAVAEVVAEVNKKLPNYKHIRKFNIRKKEFEKTTTKKIKRFGNNFIV